MTSAPWSYRMFHLNHVVSKTAKCSPIQNTIPSMHRADVLMRFFSETLGFALTFAVTGQAVLCDKCRVLYKRECYTAACLS